MARQPPVVLTADPALIAHLDTLLRRDYPRPWQISQRASGALTIQAADGTGILPLGRFDLPTAWLIVHAANTAPPPVTVDSAPEL